MTKPILLLLFALLPGICGFSQPYEVAYSDAFAQPERRDDLFAKLIQCKNGNTMLLTVGEYAGYNIDIYDPAHKMIAHGPLESTLLSNDKLGFKIDNPIKMSSTTRTRVAAFFNTGDDVALFVQQGADGGQMLYRVIISAQSGKIISEEKIAELSAYTPGAKRVMLDWYIRPKTFFVQHDAETGAYAVATFDGFSEETEKRLEVVHYTAAHKEISRIAYESPGARFQHVIYLGMAVDGEKQVYLCTYDFNNKYSGGDESSVVLSTIESGGNTTHIRIDAEPALHRTDAMLMLNKGGKMLHLALYAALTTRGMTTYYGTALFGISTETGEKLFSKGISCEELSAYREKHFDNDKPFNGIPIDILPGSDGSSTLVMQDLVGDAKQESGDLGLLRISANGTFTSAAVVRQRSTAELVRPFSVHDMHESITDLGYPAWGDWTSDILTTGPGQFIILNEDEDNFEKANSKNYTAYKGPDADAIYFRTDSGTSEKAYLFGKPNDSFQHRRADLSSADYSPATGIYAIVVKEHRGKRDEVRRVAWVHFK